MIPEVGNVEFGTKINGSLHGIADSEDVKKRQIADKTLQHSLGNYFPCAEWWYVYGRAIESSIRSQQK